MSGAGIELWHERPHAAFAHVRLHVAVLVTGVSDFVERLRGQGVVIERAPFRIGHEVIAFIRDPDGYLIELNECPVPSQPDGERYGHGA